VNFWSFIKIKQRRLFSQLPHIDVEIDARYSDGKYMFSAAVNIIETKEFYTVDPLLLRI